MAQIIQFPVKAVKEHSNAYDNLSRLFAIAESIEAVDEYAEIMVVCEEAGYFLPGEVEALREQLCQRRIESVMPSRQQEEEASAPGLYLYCEEMGQEKPKCQIEAQRSYYGKHFHINTPLELKGRGVELVRTLEDKNLNASGKYMIGWYEYVVTERAFDKLCKEYSVSMENPLD